MHLKIGDSSCAKVLRSKVIVRVKTEPRSIWSPSPQSELSEHCVSSHNSCPTSPCRQDYVLEVDLWNERQFPKTVGYWILTSFCSSAWRRAILRVPFSITFCLPQQSGNGRGPVCRHSDRKVNSTLKWLLNGFLFSWSLVPTT